MFSFYGFIRKRSYYMGDDLYVIFMNLQINVSKLTRNKGKWQNSKFHCHNCIGTHEQ